MSHKANAHAAIMAAIEADILRTRQAQVAAIEAMWMRVRLGQFDRVYESPPPVVDEPYYVGDGPAREEEF